LQKSVRSGTGAKRPTARSRKNMHVHNLPVAAPSAGAGSAAGANDAFVALRHAGPVARRRQGVPQRR